MVDGNAAEVGLAGGEPASAHFHRVLAAAVAAYPEVFAGLDFPSAAADFKRRYSQLVPEFEAARADSPQRCEIAMTVAGTTQTAIVWRTEAGDAPLSAHVASTVAPLPLRSTSFPGEGGLHPNVPLGGATLAGRDLIDAVCSLVARGSASAAVSEGISWIVGHAGGQGIDLRGRKIAVLGAAAELAPTRLWLEGGAEVLWIDVTPPPAALLEDVALSGTLHWAADGADLLRRPARIRATLETFAAGHPLDIGLYAYAPGRAREWRLAAVMNAIVDAVPPAVVRTVTMLVSPTTPGVRSAAEVAGAQRRRDRRARWQAGVERARLLGRGSGHARHGDTCANCGIVPIQGASYQAAQYLGKLMAAEAWVAGDVPRHVSANIAGISQTRSLRHPVFDTAFAAAHAFGIETFDPATTASLNGLLALRDWLDPDAPLRAAMGHAAPDRVRALAATRVHGGIYELPYPLEKTLRVATAIGVAKDPRRLAAMMRRS